MLVGGDRAAHAELEPGVLGQLYSGRTPMAMITISASARRPLCSTTHIRLPSLALDGLQPIAQGQAHLLEAHVLVDHRRHLEIERGHHLVHHFHQRHLDAPVVQVFGQLDADKAAADHNGLARAHLLEVGHDPVHIGDVAQGKHARQIVAGHRRDKGAAPGESTSLS